MSSAPQSLLTPAPQIRRVSRRHCALYKLNLLTYLLIYCASCQSHNRSSCFFPFISYHLECHPIRQRRSVHRHIQAPPKCTLLIATAASLFQAVLDCAVPYKCMHMYMCALVRVTDWLHIHVTNSISKWNSLKRILGFLKKNFIYGIFYTDSSLLSVFGGRLAFLFRNSFQKLSLQLCGACVVTAVIFRHLNRSFYLLTYLHT